VLKLALLQSGYYAAAAVHAGSFREPEEFQAIDLAQRKIPLKIIVGDRDAFFPLASVESTVAALEARQIPIELEVVERHDHWYYDRALEFNRSAWKFLAGHELETSPVHVDYRFE
jgi:pimeloyl-ACP methyl ester carboxylesterase